MTELTQIAQHRTTMLKFVKKIFVTHCRHLRFVDVITRPSSYPLVSLRYWRPFKALAVHGRGSLECEFASTNGVDVSTVTLKASVGVFDAASSDMMCYLVECVDGTSYLIGSFNPPHPRTSAVLTVPDAPSSPCRAEITVTLTAPHAIMQVID